jgi:phospholipid transport system transporter-binding protein
MSSTIALPSVLNADVAVQAQAQLRQQIQALPQGTPVVLDAAAVQSFDSAGLALLLACRRVALARGNRLQVQGWPASLRARGTDRDHEGPGAEQTADRYQ